MFAANEWSAEYKMEASVSWGAGFSPSWEQQHAAFYSCADIWWCTSCGATCRASAQTMKLVIPPNFGSACQVLQWWTVRQISVCVCLHHGWGWWGEKVNNQATTKIICHFKTAQEGKSFKETIREMHKLSFCVLVMEVVVGRAGWKELQMGLFLFLQTIIIEVEKWIVWLVRSPVQYIRPRRN